MAQECPSDGLEERVVFDIAGSSAGAQTTNFVFDEKFAYHGFAQAKEC